MMGQKKKIVAATIAHNEKDIIESQCRYTVTFCDLLLFVNNGSSDDTELIVQKLIDEKLPIVMLPIPGPTWRDELTDIAFEKYGADLVAHVDADEFLIRPDGGNPREILESMELDREYHVQWRTDLYTQEPKIPCDNTGFLPSRYPVRRDCAAFEMNKVIFGRKLFENTRPALPRGNHCLVYPAGAAHEPPIVVDELAYAHYPVRTIARTFYKIIDGEFDYSSLPGRNPDEAIQYETNIEKCLATGWLDEKTTAEISLHYSISPEYLYLTETIDTVHDPVKLDFLPEPIRLKYTDYKPFGPCWILKTFARKAIYRGRRFTEEYKRAVSSAESTMQMRLDETKSALVSLERQISTGKTADGRRTGAKYVYNFLTLFMPRVSWRRKFFIWFFGFDDESKKLK
jgi:hypothetical protein